MTHPRTISLRARVARPLAFATRPGQPAARGRTDGLLTGRRVAALAAVAGCGLLTACGTAAPAPRPTTTVTVRASTGTGSGTSASPAASPATSQAPAGVAAAGSAGCLASALQPTLGVFQGTAGTFYQVVVLTNTSASTCTLYGYPGVSFVTKAGGQQVGAAATRNPLEPTALVTLPPGGQANMIVGLHDAGNYPPAECQPTSVDWLRIYPPGDYGSVYVQYKAQTCASQAELVLSVTAVRTGTGSTGP